jgi:hypothetical protein
MNRREFLQVASVGTVVKAEMQDRAFDWLAKELKSG